MNMLNGRNSPENQGPIHEAFAQAVRGESELVPEEYTHLTHTALQFVAEALLATHDPEEVAFCFEAARKQLRAAA